MNEQLIFILNILLASFIIFILSLILINRLKIKHPKNRFGIYAVLMISIIFISLFSLTVVANFQNKTKMENLSIDNDEENISLVVVIDETKLKNKNKSSSEDIKDQDYNSNLYTKNEKEFYNENNQNVTFSIIDSPNDIKDIISQIRASKLYTTVNVLHEGLNSNEDNFNSDTINQKMKDETNDKNANIGFYFINFNIVLLILCILYLIFCLFFGKKIILKSINAKKCQNHRVIKIVEKLCEEIRIKTPKVYVFNGDPNAFIFGYPVSLVISNNLIKYLSKKELNIAIRHELAHISNKDHILKPLLQTLRILFFYNPIVHLLYKKMINERELLADSKFINNKVEKIKFMEMLFKINNLRRNKNIFTKKLFELSSLSLISHKTKKLEITDRFNNLFSYNRKKSFISTIICLIVMFSSISIIPITQNNFLDNSVVINDEVTNVRLDNDFDDKTNDRVFHSNTIYILRLIQKNSNELDIVLIEETL